jgi:hypothetical protein
MSAFGLLLATAVAASHPFAASDEMLSQFPVVKRYLSLVMAEDPAAKRIAPAHVMVIRVFSGQPSQVQLEPASSLRALVKGCIASGGDMASSGLPDHPKWTYASIPMVCPGFSTSKKALLLAIETNMAGNAIANLVVVSGPDLDPRNAPPVFYSPEKR